MKKLVLQIPRRGRIHSPESVRASYWRSTPVASTALHGSTGVAPRARTCVQKPGTPEASVLHKLFRLFVIVRGEFTHAGYTAQSAFFFRKATLQITPPPPPFPSTHPLLLPRNLSRFLLRSVLILPLQQQQRRRGRHHNKGQKQGTRFYRLLLFLRGGSRRE